MTAIPNKVIARAVADLSQGMIIATVEIAVPAERVFQALTTDEITRWWGSPETYQTTEWRADLRVGGHWRACGKGADGRPFAVEGEFLEVDPPRKLVQTWKPEWDGGHVTTITYRLETTAGGTRVTIRHEGFGDRTESCQGHTQGWERVLGWLAGHLTPVQPVVGAGAAPVRKFFLCRLLPPRPTFAQDMSEAEAKMMQEHVAYWRKLLEQGIAVVFGPVSDPSGGWGVGILQVADEAELETLKANDPTIRSGLGFRYEAFVMPRAILRS